MGDAEFLAEVVMGALGEDLCIGLAGDVNRVHLVKELFVSLASRPDSQYSYKNAFIVSDEDGKPLAGIIAYDGARLCELRRAFFEEANRFLGGTVSVKEADAWDDEADKDEIYIDSLFVIPDARKKSLASFLLEAVESKFIDSGKPLGLLVETENDRARLVYEHWGFRKVGISDFFKAPMIHMQKALR